jgi:hypothetical protein
MECRVPVKSRRMQVPRRDSAVLKKHVDAMSLVDDSAHARFESVALLQAYAANMLRSRAPPTKPPR